MPSMSSESYKTLIDLQADIKSFENSVDSHYLNYYNLYKELNEPINVKKLDDGFYFQEKMLNLKKENQDLMDMITTLERRVLDFYRTHDVPGMRQDADAQKEIIKKIEQKLKIKQEEFDDFLLKYNALEKNIQLDEKKHTMYYFIFMFWIILLGVFLYICFKIYISNKVPSITFYIFFIAAVISFYYIYLNFKNYFDF
tara:strand:+ start:4750 stop:5343 length:594 start_codon:yes stop_codon:yes gene_type:complete